MCACYAGLACVAGRFVGVAVTVIVEAITKAFMASLVAVDEAIAAIPITIHAYGGNTVGANADCFAIAGGKIQNLFVHKAITIVVLAVA